VLLFVLYLNGKNRMRETGIIVSNQGQLAQVRILRSPQCEGCPGCIDLGERQERILEADNTLGAKVGVAVECEIAPRHVLGHSFLVFLFPLLSMIAGYWLTIQYLPGATAVAEGLGIAGAFAGLILAFLLVRIIDRSWGKSHPVVARIAGYAGDPADTGAPFSCSSIDLNKRTPG
jgi:sigma-E factor negative regulatory protein RseC